MRSVASFVRARSTADLPVASTPNVLFEIARHPHRVLDRHPRLAGQCLRQGQYALTHASHLTHTAHPHSG